MGKANKGSFKPGHRRNVQHGHAADGNPTPEYVAYQNAKARCEKPTHPSYPNYGARGINMLFDSFEAFFSELGPRPSPDHTLDRIDNDRGYEPGNLRWTTRAAQAENRRPTQLRSVECERCHVVTLRPREGATKYCERCAYLVHLEQSKLRRRAKRSA